MVTEIELFQAANTKPLWIVVKNEKLPTVNSIWILI